MFKTRLLHGWTVSGAKNLQKTRIQRHLLQVDMLCYYSSKLKLTQSVQMHCTCKPIAKVAVIKQDACTSTCVLQTVSNLATFLQSLCSLCTNCSLSMERVVSIVQQMSAMHTKQLAKSC